MVMSGVVVVWGSTSAGVSGTGPLRSLGQRAGQLALGQESACYVRSRQSKAWWFGSLALSLSISGCPPPSFSSPQKSLLLPPARDE